MRSNNTRTGIVFSFISLFLLGILPILSNSRPLEISALHFSLYLLFWQLVFALPTFLLEYTFLNRGIFEARLPGKLKWKTTVIILATGSLFGISTFFYVLSMEKAGTVSAAIAIQAYPLFAILWETLFLNKKKTWLELFFTLLLIVGLYYLGTSGTWQIQGMSRWFLLALCVPLIWSVAHIIIKETLEKTPITPVQVTFVRVLVSTFIVFILSVATGSAGDILKLLWNPLFQTWAIIMGLVYFIELINWFYAVKHVDVSVASSIITPWPVVTAFLAIIFLHESIRHYQVAGLMISFICVYGILWSGGKKQDRDLLAGEKI